MEGQRKPEGEVKVVYPSAMRFRLGMHTLASQFLSKIGDRQFKNSKKTSKEQEINWVNQLRALNFNQDVVMMFWLLIYGKSAIIFEKDMHQVRLST